MNTDKVNDAKKKIAALIPHYQFHGIERFYDISEILARPDIFKSIIDLLAFKLRGIEFDAIGSIDARGFVVGSPLALVLNKPFIMIRKANKLPYCVTGKVYQKEYDGDDQLSIPKGVVHRGDRVLVVDDVIATGGSMQAALDLIYEVGGTCAGVACIIEVQALNARKRLDDAGYDSVPMYSILEENLLTL
ncbi:MAG: adenine phosphoribosyltransferase [Gammaproteobacteria bacterium]|nr:adenine phosphoribosyltransferase [Gammaproteobacteria bacterium]